MKRVILTSRSKPDLTFEDLKQILETSKVNNLKTGVVGILIHNHIDFLSCLEGEKKAIDATVKRVLADSRHYNIRVVGEEEINQHYFQEWNLGFMKNSKKVGKILKDKTGRIFLNTDKLSFEKALELLKTLKKENVIAI